MSRFVGHYWWVVLFIAVSGTIYGGSIRKKETVMASLDAQLKVLREEKRMAVEQEEDLSLQIASQSDPAWIELTLMKVLGLVPEGQSKVYFYSDSVSP